MNVVVRTVHNETDLKVPPKTSCRDLFHLMCKSLGIQETWFFGLMYRGANNEEIWIDKSKKAIKELNRHLKNLRFKVKYYPEDIDELIETITIEYFFLEVKGQIIRDEVYCPADTCVLLASYALQAKYGDYNKDEHNEDLLKKNKLLPERVIKQHSLDLSEWHSNIINMWLKHRGTDKEDNMLEYLKLVQNLEMYGVTYFAIRNKKGTDVLLGVTALGLNIYKEEDRLNPTISFPWSEIKNLKYKGVKFVIKPTDRSAKDFQFITQAELISKYILNLGIGNHELYVRRRKPDTPEIVKMKEKANEVRKNKRIIKEKYNSERLAREEAERRESKYIMEIQQLKDEMERKQASLAEAQKTIKQLQDQLEDLQKSKEELELQRRQLEEMMERLEQSKNLELAERQKLEDEIRAKHDEVQRIQEEVQRKDDEARRLQEQVEESRRREEEARLQAIEEAERRAEEQRRRELEEANHINERELESLHNADNTLPELQEVNEQLREQLKALQGELNKSKTKEEETELDRIHQTNLLQGRDKYKTLADIRRGNTVRRVEMFENM